MANQRDVTLYQGDASPKDIVLRALPVADVVETTIWLFQGDGTPSDIILRDPTATPSSGGDVTGTATAGQGAQSVAASGAYFAAVTGSAVSGQGSQSVDAVGTAQEPTPTTQGFIGPSRKRIGEAVEDWRRVRRKKRARAALVIILMSEL